MRDILLKPEVSPQVSPSAAVPPAEYRDGMRVADKVLAAFNHACAVCDVEAAEELLDETILARFEVRRILRKCQPAKP